MYNQATGDFNSAGECIFGSLVGAATIPAQERLVRKECQKTFSLDGVSFKKNK